MFKKIVLLFFFLVPFLFTISCDNNNETKTSDPVVEATPQETPEEVKYVVTFDVDGEKTTAEVKYNEKVSKPVDPVKEGYTFLGWYAGDEEFDFEAIVTADVTLVAKFEKQKYNVEVIFDNYKFEYKEITKLSLSDIEVIEGYEYIGLYLDELYQNEFDGNITDDMSLYLKYNKFYYVTIKTDNEDIIIKTYANQKLDINEIINKGYSNFKLYVDNDKKEEYSYNEIVKDEILYLKQLYNVYIYEENVLKEEVSIFKDDTINTILNDKYQDYEYYIDADLNEEYDVNLSVTSDLKIYLKKVYVYITIKTAVEEIKIRHQIGKSLDSKELLSKNYKDFILYIDNKKTTKYQYEIVNEDMLLYLEEGNCVNIYDNNILKERIVLSSNEKLNEEIYKYRYSEYEFYSDNNFENNFDFNNEISEDINIYLKPISKDEEKVKVQIIIDDYIQVFYIDKGTFLRIGDIANSFYEHVDGKKERSTFLYYDSDYQYVYNYGEVYTDLVLYGYTTDKNYDDYVLVSISTLGSGEWSSWYSIKKGESVPEEYAPITTGEEFDGYYYDSDYLEPYNGEPIYDETYLHVKTKPFDEEDNVHTLKIYFSKSVFSSGFYSFFNPETGDVTNIVFNFETKVKDGHILYPQQVRPKNPWSGLYALININEKKFYNGEPITCDSEFLVVCSGTTVTESFKTFDWESKTININGEYALYYNDKDHDNLIYIPGYTQNIITIFNGSETYQIIASLNTVITKDDLLKILPNNEIVIDSILVTGDTFIFI